MESEMAMKCIQLEDGPIIKVDQIEAHYRVTHDKWHYTSKGAYKAQQRAVVPQYGATEYMKLLGAIGINNLPPARAEQLHFGVDENDKPVIVAREFLPDAAKKVRGKNYGLKY